MLPKKILIFSTSYYPYVGGAEVAIKEITDRLPEGFHFDLLTARLSKKLSPTEHIGNVRVYRIGFGYKTIDKLLLPFLGAWKTYKLQKVEKYTSFWCVMVTYASGAAYIYNIFCRLLLQKKVPIILTLQEGDSEEHFKYRWGGLINLSWWLSLRATSFVTVLSTFLKKRALRFGYTGPIEIISNGVDITHFSKLYPESEKEDIRKKLQKKEEDIFLVTTSRLVHKNAVDDIITTLTLLPDHFRLVVIGSGDEGPRLFEQARKLGVSNRVLFLGFIPHEELPKFFSICDIFVRPSRSEGFGNSFIEAMASRLPVVATPVGGIPDFLDDKETGVFCSPDNPQSMSLAIKLLVEDKALAHRIVQNAYNRVTLRYSWDHIAERMNKEVFERM